MAAYLHGNIQIHDTALYKEYAAQVPAIISKYGGRYLVRGGAVEVVEGNVSLQRQVILEFPDMAALKAFYFSAEYTPLKDVRQRAATGTIALIEGYLP
jgi:uncharacterized protein (DUF1330 family)